MQTWIFDGGLDIHTSLSLSGEPIVPQLLSGYGNAPVPQYTASAIAAVNVAKRQYQKGYGDYWNSTEALTGTGRPVDAVVMPVAPFPAARPGKYDHYGTSPTIPEAEVRQGWGGDEGNPQPPSSSHPPSSPHFPVPNL
jgi:amidase